MLDEGFEEDTPEGSEKKPQRTYVSNAPLNDAEKLARENERLKKNLEKEQFFNRLLDQELKELKNNPNAAEPQYPDFSERKGRSRGAFFFIFLVVVGGGGFFVYKWYTKTPENPFIFDGSSSPANTQAISDTTTEAQTRLDNQLPAGTPSYKNYDPLIDSNEIVAKKKPDPADDNSTPADQAANNVKKDPPKTEEKKKPETIVADDTEDDLPVEQAPATKPNKQPVTQPQSTTPAASNNQAANKPPVNNPTTTPSSQSNPTTGTPANNNPVTASPPATRRVIGFYTNISKAYFYRAPDESTMTPSFLYQGTPVRLGALDDKNGFIYVIYVNSVGYKKEGWLSKKDLKKIE